MIEFACVLCDRPVTVPDCNAGRRMKCPHCRKRIGVPDVDDEDDDTETEEERNAEKSSKKLADVLGIVGGCVFAFVVLYVIVKKTVVVVAP